MREWLGVADPSTRDARCYDVLFPAAAPGNTASMTGRQGWPTIGPQSSLPPGLRVAGMGVRLGAWLIDSLILGLVFVGIVLAVSYTHLTLPTNREV